MNDVGPVLQAGDVATAVVAAIRAENPNAVVLDRGAYVRVRAPQRCSVRRETIERELGRPFKLPGDLELVMPSFQGSLSITDDEVVWSWRTS